MTSRRQDSGKRVHKLAEEHVKMLTEAGTELRTIPKVRPKIDGMSRGIPYQWDMQDRRDFDSATLTRVGDLIGEVAVCDMWKRNGRVAYDLNEELAAALYRSKMDEIPGSVFERLTHINPMVVLPDPWPVSDPKTGASGWVRGWFVFGWTGNALCDTNDPQRDGLGVLFFYEVVDEETGEITPGPNRMLLCLPTYREKFNVRDACEFIETWQGVPEEHRDLDTSYKILAPLLKPMFSVMTYLCCDNRDIEVNPLNSTRKKTGKNRRAPRDPFWVRVGWYVGPALHAARRAGTTAQEGPSSPSGVEYGPQHRAGHFKSVWVGPGKSGDKSRKHQTTRWVEPYWTKREMLAKDQDPVTQIVPVEPQRNDPLRRRDLKK